MKKIWTKFIFILVLVFSNNSFSLTREELGQKLIQEYSKMYLENKGKELIKKEIIGLTKKYISETSSGMVNSAFAAINIYESWKVYQSSNSDVQKANASFQLVASVLYSVPYLNLMAIGTSVNSALMSQSFTSKYLEIISEIQRINNRKLEIIKNNYLVEASFFVKLVDEIKTANLLYIDLSNLEKEFCDSSQIVVNPENLENCSIYYYILSDLVSKISNRFYYLYSYPYTEIDRKTLFSQIQLSESDFNAIQKNLVSTRNNLLNILNKIEREYLNISDLMISSFTNVETVNQRVLNCETGIIGQIKEMTKEINQDFKELKFDEMLLLRDFLIEKMNAIEISYSNFCGSKENTNIKFLITTLHKRLDQLQ